MEARQGEGRPRLRPGDVLLFHRTDAVAWLLRRFDEADVDHAAIVLDEDTVVDISTSGFSTKHPSEAIIGSSFVYVRRSAGDLDPGPVVARCLEIVASRTPCADHRIVLLALLAMTRRLPIAGQALRRLLCAVLDGATETLADLTARGSRPIVSSDLVYRCFEEVGDPRYSPSIMFPATHPPAPPTRGYSEGGESTLWIWASGREEPPLDPSADAAIHIVSEEGLDKLIAAFAREDDPQDRIASASRIGGDPGGADITDDILLASVVRFRDRLNRLAVTTDMDPWTSFRLVSNVVTPGDLRYSPSFKTMGSLRPEPDRSRSRTTPS